MVVGDDAMGGGDGLDGREQRQLARPRDAEHRHRLARGAGQVEMAEAGIVVDDVDSRAGAQGVAHGAVVEHVEDDRLALRAAGEEETAPGVEGDAARTGAAIRPASGDGAGLEIDRQGGRLPQMGIGAAVCRVDDQRLRSAGGGDEFLVRGHRRPGGGEAEDLDAVAVRLGHPDLAGRRDPAHVVGAAGEAGLGAHGPGGASPCGRWRRSARGRNRPRSSLRRDPGRSSPGS